MSEPQDDLPDDDSSRLRDRLESLLPNVIRRTVSTGVGAKQYTEDVIRGALQDVKLPREAVNHLIDVADNTKKEVVRVAAREFREFLESAKFNEELAKILTQLSFEIKTEIRFVPNDQALKPSVSTQARVKTGGGTSVAASEETTASINEAVRSNATELVEMMLGKVLRSGLKDTGEHPVAESKAGEKGDKRAAQRADAGAATKPGSASGAKGDSTGEPEKSTPRRSASDKAAASKSASDETSSDTASSEAGAPKKAAPKKAAAKPAPKRRKAPSTKSAKAESKAKDDEDKPEA